MNQRYAWICVAALSGGVACGDDGEAPADAEGGANGSGGAHTSGNGGTRPSAGAPPLTVGGGGGRDPEASGGAAEAGTGGARPEPVAGRGYGGSPVLPPEGGAAGLSGSPFDGGSTSRGGAGGTFAETAGAGGDAGSAGAVAHAGEDVYVDPGSGDDDDEGTQLEPFKTLARASAAALARRSGTIWLLDGTYDGSTEPKFAGSASGGCGQYSGVELPPGVTLRAEHPGKAELVVSGYHALCMAGGRVSGLALRRVAPGGRLLASTTGSLVIEQTTFANCGLPGVASALSGTQTAQPVQACVVASGDAEVSFEGEPETAWTSGSLGTFALARDEARVAIDGGRFSVTPGSATLVLLAAAERARLALAHLELTSSNLTSSNAGIAVHAQDGVSVSWLTSSVRGFGAAARIPAGGGAHVLIDDVLSVDNQYFLYVNTTSEQTSEITLRNLRASESKAAILLQGGRVELRIEDAELRDNVVGVQFSATGTLAIEGSRILDNQDGVHTLTSTGLYSVRLRDVEISGNTRIGLLLGGVLQGTYDLGTIDDPGENRFTNNAGDSTSWANVVVAGGQPIVVGAVGNVWDASEQGASPQGRYSVSGAGAKLDVTGGAGPNYRVLSGPTVLRLAENP